MKEFQRQKEKKEYYLLGASWNNDDQTQRFIKNGIWENGYTDEFLETVKNVSVGDRVAIKSTYSKDGRSILRIKAIGTVVKNLGDGRRLEVNWDKRISPFDLDELGFYRKTIHKVDDQYIDLIFNSNNNMSFYHELDRFLKQSKTGDLKKSNYVKSYQGLKVEVSFGKGKPAKVPWIAFLSENDTVSNGIYPVFLYYKENDLLILAYGISEENETNKLWNITGTETKSIKAYFEENNLGDPPRYHNSYVFRVYDTTKNINKEEIDNDLNELITIYKGGHSTYNEINKDFRVESFYDSSVNAGLYFSEKLITRFIASVLSKPFVILTGLTGSGKTKLAQAFASWICENKSQYCLVPVGSDWTNRDPLVGYPNALNPSEYIKPETGVLDLILSAYNKPDLPFFLILDEMNLSHVERYFADFLSALESNEQIRLHSKEETDIGIPSRLKLPRNLFIIGTVNIDETTHMFSPKVLDRANTIEIKITNNEMRKFISRFKDKDVNLNNLAHEGVSMAESFLEMSKFHSYEMNDMKYINETLLSFFNELSKVGAEFGYRTATEILRLIEKLSKIGKDDLSIYDKIDIAIMQKLLPKLHGSRRKLCPVLETLGTLCIYNNLYIDDVFENDNFDYYNNENVLYPLSLEKITKMYQNALDNGFTSFAET